MTTDPQMLATVYSGWDGYQLALVRAIAPQMIESALRRWTATDLAQTFPLTYQGTTYALPRQWILWRILSHDLHHGGELAVTLGMQGIALPDLGDEGGHLTAPPVAEPS
jgi:hypothetical protein